MSWRGCVWQADGGLTSAVLFEVFSWLGGVELARAAAVCRTWRTAAADPALWRRLLLPHVAEEPCDDKQHHRALKSLYENRQWRLEYVLAHADWELRARLMTGRTPLQHAAISSCGTRLALTTEEAAVLIWERTEEDLWREMWSRSVRACGWESVARAEWPRDDSVRLLIAGPLAVAHRWELIVLQQQVNEAEWCVVSRAGCSSGAAGCWAGADAFLALELRRLAAAHYATTVWLNAATQETQSEYAGVTMPLLRVYNEEKATITHVTVAEVPLDCADDDQGLLPDHERTAHNSSLTEQPNAPATLQTLVCGFSGASGVLRAWGLCAMRPPPILATGDLRSRAVARRAAAADAGADADVPEPDESAARAMCTPHEYECRLPAALVGLVVQPDERCAWACTADASVTCMSLPMLSGLRCLRPPASLPAPIHAPTLRDLHYVHPAISDCYFVAPSGARSGHVWVWSVRSGTPHPAPLTHAAPALVAALPPQRPIDTRRTLLVLASDQIYGSREMSSTSEGCSTDRVARHLSLAERERRLDYEREVASRPSKYLHEAPPAPFTLGAERGCARATDGRNYAIKCERKPPQSCGPDRTLPPPRCAELVRNTECTIRDGAHLDPCAHMPRTIIDIDRSANRAAPATHPQTYGQNTTLASPPPDQTPLAKNITSRIMEKLNLSRDSGASCPKRSSEPKCKTTGARRAGDTSWCQNQPKPSPVPPCYREPTTMEKIKRRGPGHCARDKGHADGKRTFHSSASSRATAPASCRDPKKGPDASVTTEKGTADAELLKKVLKERDSLQEAGRGRIVADMGDVRKSTQSTTSGRLDIPVPLGAQNVRVHVLLDGAQACGKANSDSKTATLNCSTSDGSPAKSNKNESWLSLKSLQKKLASCRNNDSVKVVKDKKHDGGSAPATCPRPQPPKPKPPMPRNPCASPAAAPRENPCPPLTPTPAAPRNPCVNPAPSAPSAPPRRTSPTHGEPTPKKPTRFSTAIDSDSLTAETLFVKW